MNKKNIRDIILKKRKELSNAEAVICSKNILNNLISNEYFNQCKSILVYVSIPGEVQTTEIINFSYNEHKQIVVPIVQKKNKMLLLSILSNEHITDLNLNKSVNKIKMWERSNFGVLEPHQDTIKPINISEIDLIIVPGLGFDKTGMRVGFGGGYYDRLLAKRHKHTKLIAVAFNFQIFKSLPYNKYDQKVDLIITENEIIKP